MMRKISGRLVRPSLAAATVAALVTPLLLTDPSGAATSPHTRKQQPARATAPQVRKVQAPETFFPVTGGKAVRDLQTYSSGHPSTDLVTPCKAAVLAAHPGIARVTSTGRKKSKRPNRYVVQVLSKEQGGLATTAGRLSRAAVPNGATVAAGQRIGTVGVRTAKHACGLSFSVRSGSSWRNPSTWLRSYVGEAPPVGDLFGDPGFVIASFNLLGASHTRGSNKYPATSVRTTKEYRLLQSHKVDVAGLQELQQEQATQLQQLAKGTFGIYHFVGKKGRADTENALIWRKSAFQFVSGDTYDVPYFNGNIRHMPVVLLRDKTTGRTAYFMNTHNPADVNGRQQRWRDRAIQVERNKLSQLSRTGRAVFLTGDFNDQEEAFCPLTAQSLAFAPNSVPSTACDYPGGHSLDWIFAAGPTRFTWFLRDTSPREDRLSDHPLLVARAHLRR